uniref:Uncharacterized protein C7orf43 homolog n=1 Tax=Saccoglossus kowalevskii TaxID=10224 RepID=A0ABM0MJ73_SACKO|nr:PREDICTED: uncharacterized protein C7orf43 homolog [Saccoglossus kowalevskii]
MAEDGSMNCNFFLYFPSSKPDKWTDFRNIVPRTYAYHGETVRFLLVSQYDGNSDNQQCLQSWHDRMQTLCMSANAGFYHEVGNIVTNTNIDALAISGKDEHGFKKCEPLSEYCKTSEISANELAKPIMIGGDTIIFPLSVTLDRLPVKMNSVDISVSLWTPEYNDKALKLHGYLKLFVESDPMAILKAASSGIQCNVNATMSLLSPPCVGCRHISVAGKQYVLVKVSNDFKDVLVLHNLKVLPNSNDNFLPPSPDGAHKNNFINKERVSKYLDVNSISMVTSRSCQLPITLKPLEKHCVVFRVHIRNYANHENTESFEVPLLLALSWSTSSQLNSEVIITHYKLPRIKINLPSLVMSASCDSPITVGKSFNVTYTVLNNLQDFISVKLLWNPDNKEEKKEDVNTSCMDAITNSVICHEPYSSTGYCQTGSTLTFNVGFQALNPGVFEALFPCFTCMGYGPYAV